MKTLNGKKYFDKKDVKDISALAKTVINNPFDNLDFLFKATSDEQDQVISGIDALTNTINWEFITETAVGLRKIEELAQTLRSPVSETLTYEQYNGYAVEDITKNVIIKYENWLKSVGIDVLVDTFKKV
tara:strand:+ start:1795 stop:2181 length:387 start_codon:yes stop_codon:yes gene_type:complete